MLYVAQSNSIVLQPPPQGPPQFPAPAISHSLNNGSIQANTGSLPHSVPPSADNSTTLAMPPNIQMASSLPMPVPAGVSGLMQSRAMYPNQSAPQPSYVQPPMPFVRHARLSLGAMPMSMAPVGSMSMPRSFRKSLDMPHSNAVAGPQMTGLGSMPMAGSHLYPPQPHPFRGSIDMQHGVTGGGPWGGISAVSLAPDFPGALAPVSSPRVLPAAIFNSDGNSGGSGAGVPAQSFRRSFEASQAPPLNPGGGPLNAEQQLMLLRGELTLMRQQMDHLNAGEGRSVADTGSIGGLTPRGSHTQLAFSPPGSDPTNTPATKEGGGQHHASAASASVPAAPGCGVGAAAHAPTGVHDAASSAQSTASISSSSKKEKGSVSRFFYKISHTGKSKK